MNAPNPTTEPQSDALVRGLPGCSPLGDECGDSKRTSRSGLLEFHTNTTPCLRLLP